MTLREFLREELIDLNVQGTTKEEVLFSMAQTLHQHGIVENVELFLNDVKNREQMGPTGIGRQVAIPHGISKAVLKTSVMIGRTQQFIPWESSISETGIQETKLIFLFCVCEKEDASMTHLMLLSELASKLADASRLQQLSTALSKQAILQAILEEVPHLDEEEDEEDFTLEFRVL